MISVQRAAASVMAALPKQRAAFLVLVLLSAVGAVFYAVPLLNFVSSILSSVTTVDLVDRDFANYWVGGRFVLEGTQIDLFTQDVYIVRLREIFGAPYPLRAWSYPPHLLLFLWPLGFLGYKAALLVFLFSGIALFLYAVAVFRREFAEGSGLPLVAIAVVPFLMMAFTAAQNSFFTAALLLLGFAYSRTRPWLAAMAFAALTVKPQLGILIPLWLALDRNWGVIAKTALLSVVLVGASALTFGVDVWTDYLTKTLKYQAFVMTDWYGIFLPMMPTVFGAVRTLGHSPDLAYAIQWPVSLIAAGAVLWLLLKNRSALIRVYTVCAGTFLITPYAFNYDMGALAIVAAVLAGSGNAGLGPFSRSSLAVVAALPALVLLLGFFKVPALSSLLIALSLLMLIKNTISSATVDGLAKPSPEIGSPG